MQSVYYLRVIFSTIILLLFLNKSKFTKIMSNFSDALFFFLLFFIFSYFFSNKMLTLLQICRIIKMVIDHITSHKFSIPFYTIVERWIPAIFLFFTLNKIIKKVINKDFEKIEVFIYTA